MCSKVHRMFLLLFPTVVARNQIETDVRMVWILFKRALHHLASIQLRTRDCQDGPAMETLRPIASLNTSANCYRRHDLPAIVIESINRDPVFSMTDEEHLRNRSRTARLPGRPAGIHTTTEMFLSGESRKPSQWGWNTERPSSSWRRRERNSGGNSEALSKRLR